MNALVCSASHRKSRSKNYIDCGMWMPSSSGVTKIFADPDACYNQHCFVCTFLANVTTIVELEGVELFQRLGKAFLKCKKILSMYLYFPCFCNRNQKYFHKIV